jgi:hypothetical protein
MDYRHGKCSQCGAQYKVPASFAHSVARCKVCKGVVHLGAPQTGGPAARSVPAAKPVPAKLVAPKPAAPAPHTARPSAPSAKKTVPPAAAAARPAETSVARPEAVHRAPKPLAAASASTPAHPSGARERGDHGTGTHGRAARHRPEPKKPPLVGLISVAALIVIAAGLFLFRGQLFGSKPKEQPAPGGEVAAATPEVPPAGAPSEPAPAAPVEDTGASGGAAAETPAEPAAPKQPAEKASRDPASIDLTKIQDFGPIQGTTPEEWAEMQEWLAQWMDVDAGAAGNRAKLKLIEKKIAAVPVILNHFKTLDFATREGRSNGDQCQKTLMQICNGTNFDWRYPDDAAGKPVDHPDDVWFCKRVVEKWSDAWRQGETSVEAWIRIAKLDDKDPAEAKRLRELYGAPQPPEGGGDDLDVD